MKAAMLRGPKDLQIEEVKDPELTPDGAIVAIKASGICGGDLPWYESGGRAMKGLDQDIQGHEWSGEILEVGANVTNVKPGDRITTGGVYGGFAERILVPRVAGVFMLPDDMSYAVGATVEPLAVSMAVVSKAEPVAGQTAIVLGAGALGQGAMLILKALGASKVMVSEVAKKRLEIAKETGADVVIDAANEDPVARVNEETSGLGVDIVVICSSSPIAFEQAFEMARGGGLYQMIVRGIAPTPGKPFDSQSPGGKIVMVAGGGKMGNVVTKALTVMGSWGGRMKEAYDLLVAGKVDTAPMVTHEFPLSEINEGFHAALARDGSVKVVITP